MYRNHPRLISQTASRPGEGWSCLSIQTIRFIFVGGVNLAPGIDRQSAPPVSPSLTSAGLPRWIPSYSTCITSFYKVGVSIWVQGGGVTGEGCQAANCRGGSHGLPVLTPPTTPSTTPPLHPQVLRTLLQ